MPSHLKGTKEVIIILINIYQTAANLLELMWALLACYNEGSLNSFTFKCLIVHRCRMTSVFDGANPQIKYSLRTPTLGSEV